MEMKDQIQRSLENQYQEMKSEREAKERKNILYLKLGILAFELIISIIGIWILVVHLGWWVALALWLLAFANNILIFRQVGEENFLIKLWKKDGKEI
jgi:hypothetical protein